MMMVDENGDLKSESWEKGQSSQALLPGAKKVDQPGKSHSGWKTLSESWFYD